MAPLPSSLDSLPLQVSDAGDVLLREQEDAAGLSGTVGVSKEGQLITRVRERGAMFGEMSILLNSKATATVSATERVECRVVKDPEVFLAEHPDVVLYICRTLARRLDSLNRYMVDIKAQFADRVDHLGMVDEVLGAIMNRHPREIVPNPNPGH